MQLSDMVFSCSNIVEQTLDRDMQVCCSFSYAFEGTYKNNKHKFIWGSNSGCKKKKKILKYILPWCLHPFEPLLLPLDDIPDWDNTPSPPPKYIYIFWRDILQFISPPTPRECWSMTFERVRIVRLLMNA